MENLLITYLQDTIQEANLFASADYRMDIEYFDRLMVLSNTMGDEFAQAMYDYITSGEQGTNQLPTQEGQRCFHWSKSIRSLISWCFGLI
jgi:hypothetical protein